MGRGRAGGIAVLTAFALLPLLAVCGLAIDLALGWLVQARLSQAADAAALAGARAYGQTAAARTTQARDMFWANFGRVDEAPASEGRGYLGATARQPTVSFPSTSLVRVEARAVLPTTIMRLFGKPETVVAAAAEASITIPGMEVALALDITGSMITNDRIGALRRAATDLVNILYGGQEKVENLWVSVVPWVTSVNVGPDKLGWLDPASLAAVSYAPTSWAGCIEARQDGGDITESPPSVQPFKPYFWASTLNRYRRGNTVVQGDNDWSLTRVTESQQQTNTAGAVGPNLGCPPQRILPLTESRSTVLSNIAALDYVFLRGGTISSIGLQAAWFTISPLWRGLWGSPTLPNDYGTSGLRKVIVMMTDGENNWVDYNGAPGASPSYTGQKVDGDYTGYGRLSENRLGIAMPATGNIGNDTNTAIARMRQAISARMSLICEAVKRRGIVLYTITFQVTAEETKSLYRDCASQPSYYFNSPDETALRAAFSSIGGSLSDLRLSR